MTKTLNEQIHQLGIVPVVKLDDPKDAYRLAEALIEGGIPCAEVTFRTDAAAESIRIMSENFPEMLVGAGTVLTTSQVEEAVANGAKFIVSPGLNPKVVAHCQKINVPIYPGVANASDIEQALEFDLEVVKFFPAEINGGMKAIQALSGPYPHMKFIPTGGVNLDNMMDYLSSDKILACGGTWMVNSPFIDDNDFEIITKISQEAVEKMLDVKLHSIVLSQNSTANLSLLKSVLPSIIETNDTLTIDKRIELKKEENIENTLRLSTNNLKRLAYVLDQKKIEYVANTSSITLNEKALNFKIEIVKG